MTMAPQVFRMAIAALAELDDVRVLLTVGRRVDLTALGPVPAHVHVASFIPQADVLATASSCCATAGLARCSARSARASPSSSSRSSPTSSPTHDALNELGGGGRGRPT